MLAEKSALYQQDWSFRHRVEGTITLPQKNDKWFHLLTKLFEDQRG